MKFVRRCKVRIGLSIAFSILAAAATAETQACEADRTPIEMAGHTLCLLNTAMPSISRLQDGSIHSLVWGPSERLPKEAQFPPGTSYVIVEAGHFIARSLEQTGPSNLPEMRQTTDGLATHLFPSLKRFHPQNARLNGQPFILECRDSINPAADQIGGQDCEISAKLAEGLRVHVFLGTVDWAGPAWPRLDEHWVDTWPPFLAQLERGINTLLFIQP